ncbi:hypothetical protein ACVDG5_010770 [Mesorhizobium sp. ORM6]
MNGGFEGVWPEGVPTTLWNYVLLKPEERWSLPFMGIRPDWGFVLWFLFGAVVIAIFSRQRFRQRTFDPSSFDYRVLRELAPTQLTGRGPVRRAYAYYAGTLIAIYFAMTFFGGLILRTVGTIPMAGLQVKVDDAILNSTQWPLTLALAFAGFAPMIKPLELVETWLRQRAHQWVGIPVRIKDHTRQLLSRLESIVSESVPAEVARLPSWAVVHIEGTDSVSRVMISYQELELLIKMTREEDIWPTSTVRDELRRLEAEQIAEAELVLQSFDEIIATDYFTTGPVRVATGGAGVQEDALKKHQRRLEAKLAVTIQQIDRLRDEFGSIFTVFAERDRTFAKIRDPKFAAVMQQTFPDDKVPPGPDVAILLLLFPVFLIYAAMTAAGLHSLLGGVEKSTLTVFATAALETMRIAVIFWMPTVTVFLWRRYLKAHNRWHPIQMKPLSVRKVKQALMAMGLAALVAAIGLGLLALLWMAIVADNPGRFRELLFNGKQPALAYFLGQAVAAPIFALTILYAVDNLEAEVKHRGMSRLLFGFINAALVCAWMMAHLTLWSTGSCESKVPLFLDCFRYYNVTDFIIYAVIALLSASVFARPVQIHGKAVEGPASAAHLKVVTSTAGVLIVALVCVIATTATAQTTEPGSPPVVLKDKKVVLGFRNDAEPFSYRVDSGGDQQFVGYIADLCYRIFAGSDYLTVSVAVDANDRFKRLRKSKGEPAYDPHGAERDQKIDVLCDPVTLRFSDPDVRADGIFSPIVFASGVSYLLRRTRTPRSGAFLAYVADTTAAVVAQRACLIDLFGVRSNGGQEQDCTPPSNSNNDCPIGEMQELPTYRFCVMQNHDELIKWFCQNNKGTANYQLAYFGDREIILAKLAAWTERHGCPVAEIEQEHPYFTYEPYALLVSKVDPDLVQFVQRRTFEFFSHRSEAVSLFTEYFPGVRMSPTVANLFLLNGVAEERLFTSSSLQSQESDVLPSRADTPR